MNYLSDDALETIVLESNQGHTVWAVKRLQEAIRQLRDLHNTLVDRVRLLEQQVQSHVRKIHQIPVPPSNRDIIHELLAKRLDAKDHEAKKT